MPPPDSKARGAASARSPDLPWHHRLNITSVSLIIFLLAIAFSLPAMRGSGRDLDHAGNLVRFLKRFFPPDLSVSGQILEALMETIQIAILATFFSILLAFPLAVAGAQTLSPRWLVVISRMIMNCIRTIPGLIWALIAVAMVAVSTGRMLGLSFYSLGYLGKVFGDAFESVDLEVARGLRAIGAGKSKLFSMVSGRIRAR